LKSEQDPDARIEVEGKDLNFDGEIFFGIGDGSEICFLCDKKFGVVSIVVVVVDEEAESTG
jgi:hypothetical protein